ncbi:hypothetical protein SO694_00002133 [Aureococcus anophagefferens]|uniref:Uncharacterized protein n=1 Tax=Aureococcus anophagefferens TaxID=44056 RepID=A0ABR1GC28_AURAN
MRAPLANFGVLLSLIVAGGASRALAVKCSEITNRKVCKSAAYKKTCSWSKGKKKCKGKRKACGSLAKKNCRKSKYHNFCQWSFATEACRKVKCEEIDAKRDCKSKRVAGKRGCEWKDDACAVGSDSEDAPADSGAFEEDTDSGEFEDSDPDSDSRSDSDSGSGSDSGAVDCDELARGDTGGDTASGGQLDGGMGAIVIGSGCTFTTTQAPADGDRSEHEGFPGRRLADARRAAPPLVKERQPPVR